MCNVQITDYKSRNREQKFNKPELMGGERTAVTMASYMLSLKPALAVSTGRPALIHVAK